MTDGIPSTRTVRDRFIDASVRDRWQHPREAEQEFNRWLDDHDREVAWQEVVAMRREARNRGDVGHPEGISLDDWLASWLYRIAGEIA